MADAHTPSHSPRKYADRPATLPSEGSTLLDLANQLFDLAALQSAALSHLERLEDATEGGDLDAFNQVNRCMRAIGVGITRCADRLFKDASMDVLNAELVTLWVRSAQAVSAGAQQQAQPVPGAAPCAPRDLAGELSDLAALQSATLARLGEVESRALLLVDLAADGGRPSGADRSGLEEAFDEAGRCVETVLAGVKRCAAGAGRSPTRAHP